MVFAIVPNTELCSLSHPTVGEAMSGEHVLICVAGLMPMVRFIWPRGRLLLPPDIQARLKDRKARVLMVSGSDEHGTPITVTAETQEFHRKLSISAQEINMTLMDLGCSWEPNIDSRGPELEALCLTGLAS